MPNGCAWLCVAVCGCGWEKRAGGVGRTPKAIVARTMPRPHDVGWCGWVCGGCGWVALKNAPKLCKGWVGAWKGRTLPRAWDCALDWGDVVPVRGSGALLLNYDDTSIHFGRLTSKIVTLIAITLPFCPHSCTFIRLWVCYF